MENKKGPSLLNHSSALDFGESVLNSSEGEASGDEGELSGEEPASSEPVMNRILPGD